MNAPEMVAPDRSKFIGGSDAAAVLGISPWRSPLDLYLDKIQPRVESPEEQDNRTAKLRGKRLEPYICDMLTAEHGVQLVARNQRYVDGEHPFLACEIDAETADGENVEIKTVHPFKARDWGEELTDSIPVHYTAQAMHGLMVTGRDVCRFAVLIGDELRLYRVERDVETIAAMREREVQFWQQHVLARVAPPAVSSSDVLRLFERDLGTTVVATPGILEACASLRVLKGEAKELGAEIDRVEELIKLHMGGAASLVFDGQVLATWKAQTARRLDQKALEAAHPDIVEKFKRASESRVFRLK
jgi:putative phage-type endonuclease